MKYIFEKCDQIKKNETTMGVQKTKVQEEHIGLYLVRKSYRKIQFGKLDVAEKITLNVTYIL
jgi:hypothetical protein